MIAMSPDLEMETHAEDGLIKSATGALFAEESFFLNSFVAPSDDDFIMLAPPMPGDITVIEMNNEHLLVQSGSYMASSTGIEINTEWEGAKSFFAGEGLVMLEMKGTGTLLLSSFGAFHSVDLKADEKIFIDTGHLVALDPALDYKIKKVAGWKSTVFRERVWW